VQLLISALLNLPATFVGFKQHYAFVLAECEPMLKPPAGKCEEGE
jgi:hypothetical protein